MTPSNYLSEEYEIFRLLKCSPDAYKFYHDVTSTINTVANRIWPYRVKFPEQLVDLQGSSIYIVETIETRNSLVADGCEDSTVHVYELNDMVMFKGKTGIVNFSKRVEVTHEELAELTDVNQSTHYLLSSSSNPIFQLFFLNMIPYMRNKAYDAVFYDKDTAHEYAEELQLMLRKGINSFNVDSRII